ncbi:hypothetical protein SDC9_163354 [bioreactor metagenome]|uniref:Uncharacterized protein n=1 Tax=bioreactor metagenome TaxID=1076179 RepID=A0A645FQM7_9ZZZZ
MNLPLFYAKTNVVQRFDAGKLFGNVPHFQQNGILHVVSTPDQKIPFALDRKIGGKTSRSAANLIASLIT